MCAPAESPTPIGRNPPGARASPELGDLLRCHGERYAATHPVSSVQRSVIRALSGCRTAALACAVQGLPSQVSRGPPASLRSWEARRRHLRSRVVHDASPSRLGRLRQAPFRRPRTRPGLSGRLYASHRDLEPSHPEHPGKDVSPSAIATPGTPTSRRSCSSTPTSSSDASRSTSSRRASSGSDTTDCSPTEGGRRRSHAAASCSPHPSPNRPRGETPRRDRREALQKLTGIDLEQCPSCREGRMDVVAEIKRRPWFFLFPRPVLSDHLKSGH